VEVEEERKGKERTKQIKKSIMKKAQPNPK
jgi:hypothetical protein